MLHTSVCTLQNYGMQHPVPDFFQFQVGGCLLYSGGEAESWQTRGRNEGQHSWIFFSVTTASLNNSTIYEYDTTRLLPIYIESRASSHNGG